MASYGINGDGQCLFAYPSFTKTANVLHITQFAISEH